MTKLFCIFQPVYRDARRGTLVCTPLRPCRRRASWSGGAGVGLVLELVLFSHVTARVKEMCTHWPPKTLNPRCTLTGPPEDLSHNGHRRIDGVADDGDPRVRRHLGDTLRQARHDACSGRVQKLTYSSAQRDGFSNECRRHFSDASCLWRQLHMLPDAVSSAIEESASICDTHLPSRRGHAPVHNCTCIQVAGRGAGV